MSAYKDPILSKIETLIDASDGGAIKTFYHGDPLLMPKDDLPTLCLIKDTSEIGDESNAEDYHRMTVNLTLIVDIRDYFDETPRNVHVGDQKMYDIFEGRDSNYTLKSTSIVDILRSNADLTNNTHIDLAEPMIVDYGFTLGKRGERTWAQEANLSVPIFMTQLR